MVRGLLWLLALLLAAAPASARPAWAWQLRDPWPDPATITGITVRDVTFPTTSPFSPADLAAGAPVPATVGRARLFLPAGAQAPHSVPAVVLLHGAAGAVPQRGDVYGAQLAAMGIAAMVVDTYGARRDMAEDFVGRVLHITETMFVADAYAALRYLARQPEIDARHVVLTGFSYGGMATTYAIYAQMAQLMAPDGLRFAGHVAFYGPCIARFEDSRTTGAPLLMLYGAEDELIRPDRCATIAADLRAGGSAVTIVSYPGAVHQWDGALSRRLIGRNLSACRFEVERDGTVRDRRTFLPMSSVFWRKVILALCVSSKPYPIGRDDTVRAESDRDFGRFLTQVFSGAGAKF